MMPPHIFGPLHYKHLIDYWSADDCRLFKLHNTHFYFIFWLFRLCCISLSNISILFPLRLKWTWFWSTGCHQNTSFCQVFANSWPTSSTLPRTTSSTLFVRMRQSCPRFPVYTRVQSKWSNSAANVICLAWTGYSFMFWSLANGLFFWSLLGCCCSWPLRLTRLRPAWPSAPLWRAAGTCWRQPRSKASRWWAWPSTSPAPAKTYSRLTPMPCRTPAVCLTWGWVQSRKYLYHVINVSIQECLLNLSFFLMKDNNSAFVCLAGSGL